MRILFLLWPFFYAAALHGQEVPRMRSFSPDQYHCQNQNWALSQSPEGWIFAGNNGGLLKFDGSVWQTYTLPDNQTVRAVGCGTDGRIYCGGFAEFGYWESDADTRMQYVSLSKTVRAQQLGKEEIWHILVCDRFVLFQTFSTIYKYDFQKVTVLQPPSSIMFAHELNGRVLVPAIGRGIYELLADNTFRFVSGSEPLADKIVQFLIPLPSGGFWAGTTNHGMFQVENGRCMPWTDPLNAEFKKTQLNRAVPLRQGGWAIGTILNGLYILDAEGRLKGQINRSNGLQNNTVLALLEDRQGNLWTGLDRGIDLVVLDSPIRMFTDLTGKIGTVYTAAAWNGRLYIGTNQGVFVRENDGLQLVEGTQGQVWQLQVFADRLLCGHNAGTFLIQGNHAVPVSDITGGWCTVAMPGADERVLLQSTYTGLVVFRLGPDKNWRLDHRIEGFKEPLKRILFDSSGNLWGSHPNKGLFRMRLSADLTQILEYKSYSREDGLPTDFKLDLTVINGKPVTNTRFCPLGIQDSAGHIVFKPLSPPDRRQKWLPGSGASCFIVDSSGVTLQTPDAAYPLPLTLVPGFENIIDLNPNEYLCCLENGYALLDKRRLTDPKPEKPPVYVHCRGAELEGGEPVVLNFRENNLKFRFSVPYYLRAPLFSWRLEGMETGWSAWQAGSEKEFANLPPGRYVLHVRADVANDEAVFRFQIKPPWYLSGWAVAFYVLVLIGLLALAEQISRTRLGRQRLHLESEKYQELSRQRGEAEREMLALEVQNKSRELSNAALNLIRKNETLQHLRDELLRSANDPRALQKLTRLIDRHLEGDHDWEVFEESFNNVHDDFFKRIMHEFPDLTPGDLRLAAYLKMNLSSKEIAPLLNISVRGVENKRYRLRKKLGLPEDANLTEFIMAY